MGRKEVRLREFPTPEKAEHIKLVKGVYKINPHVHVLCPILATNEVCKRKEGSEKGMGRVRPKFLIKNFNNPKLELWQCDGCKDFLLRVEL